MICVSVSYMWLCFIEIDDAVAELTVPMHKLPPSHLHGLLRSTGYPSDAVKLLSAETGVRIFVSDRRDSVSYRGRDSQSHSSHSHSNVMSITLEGSVPAVFQALKSFAETLGSTHKNGSSSHSPIPQPEGGCRFIGDESKEKSNSTTSNNSSSNKDNWRHRDKDSDGADHQADYEQHVNVPTTLVGLLFAKRDPDPNVLKQIQRGTRTQLEKLPEPIVPSSHHQQQDDSADKKVGEDVKGSKDVNKKTQRHAAVVTFAVRGGSAAAVELGASCLLRIVAGDKIVTVLSDLSANKGQERHRTTVTDVSSSTQSRKEVVPVQEEDQENVAAASISGKGGGRGSGRGGKNMRGGKGGKGKPYAGRGGGKHTESDSGTGGRQGGVKAAAKAGV